MKDAGVPCQCHWLLSCKGSGGHLYHFSRAENSLLGGTMGLSVEIRRPVTMFLQSSRSVFLTPKENVFDIVTLEKTVLTLCGAFSILCPILF